MITTADKWSAWLLEKRFGGDAEAAERGMRMLYRVRDSILDEAKVAAGETVLDIGCGDGLVAFGALDRAGERGKVIFSDISEPLLDRCRALARELDVLDRCEFVNASADDLAAFHDESVEVVTTRSVLIYVRDKERAFREFYRVLRPGGRISLWEPINRFNATYDAERDTLTSEQLEIAHLWRRIGEHFRAIQPLDSDPMMNFDEYDLLRHAEDAGFRTVHLATHVYVLPSETVTWDTWLNTSGNPNIPAIGEMLHDIFSPEEFVLFEKHARPALERGGRPSRSSFALLSATKVRETDHA
ncbi:MAG: class I SAM-dependent methyltransferase [Dehalococcoidia bacterium]